MGCFICFVFWIAAILVAIKLWVKLTTGWCKSNVCLVGKTAIVTGGNAGIGYHTAEDFAKRGAKVILACRNKNRGQDAVVRIIRETNNPNVIFKQLDLGLPESVRQFAQDINKSEERLDILVNNAGIASAGLSNKNEDSKVVMQTNYFGPFLLTNLLLDLIKKTPDSRIVNVSSMAGKYADCDVNKLNPDLLTEPIKESKAYFTSKLCNILFTIELAERLRGTSTNTYSLHPGVVATNIFSTMPPFRKFLFEIILKQYIKTSLEGAQTTIYCSVEKNIEHLSGEHFHDCHVVKRYKSAQDPILPKKLWQVTEELVELTQE